MEEGKGSQEGVLPQVYKSDKYKCNNLPTTMGQGGTKGVLKAAESVLTCL